MHICYVADARSPIAKSWISYFVEKDYRVTVISSYPCDADAIPGAKIIQFPFALSARAKPATHSQSRTDRLLSASAAVFGSQLLIKSLIHLRACLAPRSIRRRSHDLARLFAEIKPDLVHAMRLPYEGIMAATAINSAPLLISTWGNDFTLFAAQYPALSRLTDAALRRADGLHCDCRRDLDLATARSFSLQNPHAVLPGNGGLDCSFYFSLQRDAALLRRLGVPENRRIVINPRGLRAYVRNDVFFKAVPLVVKHVPDVFFVAPAMRGSSTAERWKKSSEVSDAILLLPIMEREDIARLLASSDVMVSPSSHDGTPNSLLETMACGCFPILGGVDSIEEWITDGHNGLFCDESNPESLAAAVIRALNDSELRNRAAAINRNLISRRAERDSVMTRAEHLYREVIVRDRQKIETLTQPATYV